MRAIDCPCGHPLKPSMTRSCSSVLASTSPSTTRRCSAQTSRSASGSPPTPTKSRRSPEVGRVDQRAPHHPGVLAQRGRAPRAIGWTAVLTQRVPESRRRRGAEVLGDSCLRTGSERWRALPRALPFDHLWNRRPPPHWWTAPAAEPAPARGRVQGRDGVSPAHRNDTGRGRHDARVRARRPAGCSLRDRDRHQPVPAFRDVRVAGARPRAQ